MLIAVDIETKGLDATKFLCGTIVKETGKPEIFTKKEEMWERILQLGQQCYNNKKVLNVYAHNHQYDFYGYANLKDPNIIWFCTSPFIVAYQNKETGREYIKFLDTMALYGGSLKSLGELINYPKMEMPEYLMNDDMYITENRLKEIEPYMVRDAEIVLKGVRHLKTKLKNDGINLKRLYTKSQIAIQYLLHEIKKLPNEHIFKDPEKLVTHKIWTPVSERRSYRQGRVDCFKTGLIQNVTQIDCNSLYPYASTLIKFPDLRTKRVIPSPLKTLKLKDIITKIGVSRCLIKNETNNFGLLPIRTNTGNYYPKSNKYLLGTWTHIELSKAIKEGYKILDIAWSIVFDEGTNPFKTIMPKIYKKRNESGLEFDKSFYKIIMNHSIGKLAQAKTGQIFVMDSIDKTQEYLKQNYESYKHVFDYTIMYRKEPETTNELNITSKKPYYAPIIPTLITAKSRMIMHDHYMKIPTKDLCYTDTDSITFTGNHLNKFDIGTELGQFKTQHVNQECKIYGKKTYMIGDVIKMSGFKQRNMTPEQFLQGRVKVFRMVTIKTFTDIKTVGSRIEQERDLNEQLHEHTLSQEMLSEPELYRDIDIKNINYFIPTLKQHLKTTT